MSNVADGIQPDFDGIADVAVDPRIESRDAGLRFDLRLCTRTSMPPLWRSAAARASTAVPNCDALLRQALHCRQQSDTEGYERIMTQLVRFFTDGDAAPARTPAEVRAAFRLGDATSADLDNERLVLKEMRFLDHDATFEACFSRIDVDKISAVDEAERRRATC